jgi:hypothetical protein
MLINCTVTGLSPLLVHAIPAHVLFPEATRAALNGGEKKTPQEQARASLYLGGKDGKTPVLPAANIYKAIIEAGRLHKVGKRQITTRDTSMVPSGIWIEESELVIESPEPWTVHSKMVTNEATKSKVPSHRPRWDKWSVSFTLQVDDETFSENLVRTLVNDAGKRIGVGSHRPERKGPFGRFSTTGWTVKK